MIAPLALDLSRPRRLHLLGIGGSGMAPFAHLLRAEGHTVTGADAKPGASVMRLREAGIPVMTGLEADLLPSGTEAVIHTAAIASDAPALVRARALELPLLKYAKAVALHARDKRTLAVAGTHGKTTTTALLAHVMRRAGCDPSYLLGGSAAQLPPPGRGSSRFLVLEACEFDRSFLHFHPEIAIVTNVEADHLDYYRDIVEICAAFRTFAAQVSGLLVLHEGLRETIARAGGIRAKVRTFGPTCDADWRFVDGGSSQGVRRFACGGREYRLRLPGAHNVLNAAAVLAVAAELGLDPDAVSAALESFEGVGRRLQVVGSPRGVAVVDDYAHHPTEVLAGLRALRDAYQPRRLWCVFQPHQYSRLRRFLHGFAEALSFADCVVIPEIYAARDGEEDRRAVTAGDLVREVKANGGQAEFIPDFESIVDFVRAQARAGDVVVTMGAGDVGDVAGRLAAAL